MKTLSPKEERAHWRPSDRALNAIAALIGLVTLAVGVGWLIYSWTVDLEVPFFEIPLVITVPVIAAAAFRCLWD
ncbi:hypothetical protein BKK79_19150 [Cupriavidus sp. USMAA2-4]|uniref:Uncharacterized protein n=1 Tax=Cupriavidus malaysiensis TaxID=367825 RepID=A0ABM6F561_9BURK|nr:MULTISPECIES: hypothetical protein [Cupriavidus]AOY93685.1 hypothetical protein BKK79_19150 [Cupriavidus sp. USMAA2-4]AOZ00039.1 hypothetical protein BKK81_12930 [Cupriavidus sp. USMAHM13]AOZ06651.1 hypothetical protein BKK80_13145 [Cupriavidus malaysiensis]